MEYICLHDLVIDRELAFKRHCTYQGEDNIIYGCNGKQWKISELPVLFDLYFDTVQPDLTSIVLPEKKEVPSYGSAASTSCTSEIYSPPHYSWLKDACGVEVAAITRHLDFDLGNVVKYVLRAGRKGDKLTDLKKALWYLQDEIKMLETLEYA